MARPNLHPSEIPPGQILTYFGDLASGAIRPEDVRIEAPSYQVIIDLNGQIQFQTPKISIVSRYNFAFRGVWAQVLNPELAGAGPSLVRFNVQEQGRSFNVFKQPVPVQAAMGNPYHWDGIYMCVPGTDLAVDWTVNTTLWITLVNATRIFEVSLIGDLIACAPTQQ